jgi:hypothetical protein
MQSTCNTIKKKNFVPELIYLHDVKLYDVAQQQIYLTWYVVFYTLNSCKVAKLARELTRDSDKCNILSTADLVISHPKYIK